VTLLIRNGRAPQIKLRPTQFNQGRSLTVPAPYGGLNLRDDITSLKPNEARVLENWFATSGQLSLRPGNARHVGSMGGGEVKTLAAYIGYSSNTLLAAAGGSIYRVPFQTVEIEDISNDNPAVVEAEAHGFQDGQKVYITGVGGMTEVNNLVFTVANKTDDDFELSGTDSSGYGTYTSGGTASLEAVSLATGFTNDRWQTALYSNRLFFVNGADTPQVYNGSTVANIAWAGSGLTSTNLINIALVRNRLWFCEKNSADVWYANVGQITDASNLTKFQLSQIAGGGYCMAIGSWSRDAGDGADDMTVFVMSTGEILIYQGDPGSTFSLIGKYATGAQPIGRQCLFRVGGELIVITKLGLLPVSAAIGGVALDLARIDPWGKIAPGFVEDAARHSENEGWHGCLHEGVVYVNVPLSVGGLSKQWVLNTRNGSWQVFTKWNGSSFCSFNGELYFGGSSGGTVYEVGGPSDRGESIEALASCAFVTPSSSYLSNMFTAIRPKIDADGAVTGMVGVDTDFIFGSQVTPIVDVTASDSLTPWGSPWGSPWGNSGSPDPTWFTITGVGRSVSVRFRASSSLSTNFRWFATDLLYKPGGIK
jgi:hypothetical protein